MGRKHGSLNVDKKAKTPEEEYRDWYEENVKNTMFAGENPEGELI